VPTVVTMHWPEVSKEEYERARRQVNWEGNVPQGTRFHVTWFADDGFHVVDLWDSREDFERFVERRLMPAVKEIGIRGEPRVQFAEAHAVFAPNV